jgi:LCP family protein required for cell wall assembly
MMAQRAISRHRTETKRRRLRTVMIILVSLIAISGVAAYAFVSNTIGTITDTLGKVIQTPETLRPGVVGPNGEQGTPIPIEYPDWSKNEPLNILLIGLDYRPGEQDSRADTQIIVHINPAAKTAAMVAIPRDLWVPIPGYGEGRINSAFQHGETDKLTVPGGGPGLAMATIEDNFGIPIQYYAQVDFTGFEEIIDTMGGLTIDVPKPLVDNDYPLGNYGVTRIYIPAGLQHMDGRTALAYARSRHADSDLGRNSRQQQVLLALRQQGLNLNLITKLNELAGQLSGAVKTNLKITEIGSLATLSKQIDLGSIQTVQIDANMVSEVITDGGADVLVPNWELIKPKIAQAFADPKLAKEAARLSVQNGTLVGGLGKKLHDALVEKGYYIPDLRSVEVSEQGKYPKTVIIDYTGGQKPVTIDALTKELGIAPTDVQEGRPTQAPIANGDGKPVDIAVIVGEDRAK